MPDRELVEAVAKLICSDNRSIPPPCEPHMRTAEKWVTLIEPLVLERVRLAIEAIPPLSTYVLKADPAHNLVSRRAVLAVVDAEAVRDA